MSEEILAEKVDQIQQLINETMKYANEIEVGFCLTLPIQRCDDQYEDEIYYEIPEKDEYGEVASSGYWYHSAWSC